MYELLELAAQTDTQAARYLEEIKRIEKDGGFERIAVGQYECRRANCNGCPIKDKGSSFRCQKWVQGNTFSFDMSEFTDSDIKKLMGEL